MASLIAALAALALAGVLSAQMSRRLQALRRQQKRIAAVASERRVIAALRAQLAAGQDLAENLVEGGTSTVRAVHKGIAAIPFGILESIPVTRDTTRLVRQVHDLISDGVYGGIAATNKALHGAARGAIKPAAAPEKPDSSDQKK